MMADIQTQDHERVFSQLERYVDNDLVEAEVKVITEHLKECKLCQRRLAELYSVEQAYRHPPAAGDLTPEYQAGLLERLRTDRGARRYDLIKREDLEALAAFQSQEYPVVSLYLDVRAEERQGDKARAKLKHLIDETKRRLANDPKDRQRAFQLEADWLLTWFTDIYDQTGRGLAIFTAIEHELWRAFRLPVPVRDQLLVADRLYLRPLVTLMDEFERYLVLLVDKQTARLFVVFMGEIEEVTEFMDELVPHPKAGGWSAEKYQRHHDMHVLWHVKHAVEVATRLWESEHCQWLLIGGTKEPLAEIRRHLPKALSERLAGEISVSLEDPLDVILAEVRAVEQATERQVEAERVETLLTAALGYGPGVLGLAQTLEAIVEGRVHMLVVEEDFHRKGFECPNCHYLGVVEITNCPLCGTPINPQVDIVERAIERTLDQDGIIEVLRGEMRQALADHGHIGALLRYATSHPVEEVEPRDPDE